MLENSEFWAGVLAQGGATVIAVLIFLAYRKDVKGTADVLILVVRENTASNVEMSALLKALHHRMDLDGLADQRVESRHGVERRRPPDSTS